ncbi:MAG: hypothetical protein JWM95_669 [Gemmatimonadetes bacterium]|nr:hypothetical protein [Gemmatimonadota bacterium]
MNLYGFGGGDPVNFSDPFGLCTPWPQCSLQQVINGGGWKGNVAAVADMANDLLLINSAADVGVAVRDGNWDAALTGVIGIAGSLDGGAGLGESQAANLARFEKKMPNGASATRTFNLPLGGKAFQSEVPGRVPGSKAIYEKQVDASGTTMQYTKTTVDPSGNIVHVKDKMSGDVIKP